MSESFVKNYRKELGLNEHQMRIFLKYMAKDDDVKVPGLSEYLNEKVGTDPDQWDGLEINRTIGQYIKDHEEKFTQTLKG